MDATIYRLLRWARAKAEHDGVSLGSISKSISYDSRFLDRLANGRGANVRSIEKAMSRLRALGHFDGRGWSKTF